MVGEKVTIKNPTGLHLRPAGKLCEEARKYQSKITLKKDDKLVNAKSLLGLLGACIKSGDEVEFLCEGEDEQTALKAITALVDSGLDE